MSPARRSIGKDPLDWIGEGAPGLIRGDNGRGAESGRPPRAPPAPGTGGEEAAARPSRPTGTALTLERQLLLMDGLGPKKRPISLKPSSRVLLLLILLFAGLGTVLLFIQEARGRWNDQVQTLKQTISGLEEERRSSVQVLNDVIQEKDEVIREKQKIIRDLQAIQERTLEEASRAWAEARRIQELFHKLLWNPFRPSRAEGAPEGDAATAVPDTLEPKAGDRQED